MTEEIKPASAGSAELCLPPHLCRPRLRRREAVEYLDRVHGLPIAYATLEKLACVGGGPSFQKAGNVPLYMPAELDAWAMARLGGLRRSTSDKGDR